MLSQAASGPWTLSIISALHILDRSLYHLPCISIFIAVILLVIRLWQFTLYPWLHPREPRVLPHWIPCHAVSFFNDADGTFTYGREYFGDTREPFTLRVAGERLYIMTSPTDISAIYKNIKQLTFDDYITDMMVAFGASKFAISRMWQPSLQDQRNPKNPPYNNKPLAHIAEDIIRTQLHPGKHLDRLQDTLLRTVHSSFTWSRMTSKIILAECSTYRTVSLLEWTREALLAGATTAFFGPALLQLEPALFQSFFDFDDRSWKLTYKLPRPFSNDMLAAKKTAQVALTKYFELPREQRPGACWLVETLEDEMKMVDIGVEDMAAYLMMIYWVINANTWKVSFWMLAYMLHNPNLMSAIRAEVTDATSASSPAACVDKLVTTCPLLVAFYQEILRLVTSSVSVRNVATDVVIGGKLLRKGSRVIIPYRQTLFNRGVFGADAEGFNVERFLVNKSLASNPSFRPFGGGTTYCPGRFLAKTEVLTAVAVAAARFDMELVPEGYQGRGVGFPQLEMKKPCLGIMAPVDGDDVVVRIRAPEESGGHP